MEEQQLKQLRSKNIEDIQAVLTEFNSKHADLFNLSQFHINDQWYVIWVAVFDILSNPELLALNVTCLNTIRILTRDEHSLQTHDVSKQFKDLLELAQLTKMSSSLKVLGKCSNDEETTGETAITILEATKCICNLVYQNLQCRRLCIAQNITDFIMKRLIVNMQLQQQQSNALELYDLKLLYLLTGLEPAARNRVQFDSNGVTYLTEWLDEILQEYNPKKIDVLIEMLKVLFNLTSMPSSVDKNMQSGNEIQCLHIASVLRELLLLFAYWRTDKERQLVTHAINELTNLSSSSLSVLLDGKSKENASQHVLIYEGHNVRIMEILLRYLRQMLQEQEKTIVSYDSILPVLTVLVKCARSKRVMRHYIRSVVLPPLRYVCKRPEQGNELRNYLCRFLTLPDALVRDLSAELLFICCKENVTRMIKYTGYGNAAGLFAKRGLLDCRTVDKAEEYSSDSEDSDTEEYKTMQHGINPVIGCYETPKPNPTADMSEEQKEFEAVQLANLIDKLQRTGVMQPCRIDEDGKPQPVEHILQLQEELPQQQLQQKHKT